jgi:hypothetical protein
MLSGNHRRSGHAECAAHIEAALAGSQSGLAPRGAQTHESAGRQGEPQGSVFPAQRADHLSGQNSRLVEAAARTFRSMERHGNHQHVARHFIHELQQGAAQQLAEPAGGGAYALVFECMNQVSQAALIGPYGDGFYERGRSEPAGATETGRLMGKRPVERIATADALLRAGRFFSNRNLRPAGSTNWNERGLRKRSSAEGARGWEDCASDCVKWTSEHARYGSPSGNL